MTHTGIVLSLAPFSEQGGAPATGLLCLEVRYFSVLWAGERIERPAVSLAQWDEIADQANVGLPSVTREPISPAEVARIMEARHRTQDLLGHLLTAGGRTVQIQWRGVLFMNVPGHEDAEASLDALLRSIDSEQRAHRQRDMPRKRQ